jgi:hypothetical protein
MIRDVSFAIKWLPTMSKSGGTVKFRSRVGKVIWRVAAGWVAPVVRFVVGFGLSANSPKIVECSHAR